MATKKDKSEWIRNQIVLAAHVYKNELVGKVFLYVFGNNFFEVVFKKNCFMHLTGVGSKLNADEFYRRAKKVKLSTKQIDFDCKHSYAVAKKKIPCLLRLPELTKSLVCVLKDMNTLTFTYRIGITNLNFTIGLTENLDFSGNKINDWLIPRTLRVKDRAIENSGKAELVDFIFEKSASCNKYEVVTFCDSNKKVPDKIKYMLSSQLIEVLNKEV